MTVDQVVGGLASIRKRIRAINARYDGLENQLEAMNVVQAALHEMSTLHELLPADLKGKSWVFLSLERGRAPWRSSSN
ncbi:MAG TPA: hypothetical protein VJT32_16120 [bacterium]|nr:hypothetical protein [bacterium]